MQKSHIFQPSLLAALVATAFPAVAQTSQPIEHISITASRTNIDQTKVSGALTILDEQQIQQTGLIYLADLLRAQSGLSVAQSGGTGSLTEIRMRGSEANHVLVLVDGVVINDVGQSGQVDFGHITLDSVTRVEILRGPQSALWGSSAIGGVISISTKGAPSTRLFAEVGQDNSQHYSITHRQQQDALDYRVNVSHITTDGSNIAPTGDEKDGHHNSRLSLGADWQINSKHQLTVQLSQRQGKTEYDGSDFVTGWQADADLWSDFVRRNASAHWQWQAHSTLNSTFGWQWHQDKNDSFNAGANAGRNHSKRQRLFWQADWQYSQQGRASVAAEQVTESYTQRDLDTTWGDPNQTRSNKTNALVVDLNHTLAQDWYLSLSGRYDNHSEFDSAGSYRLGLAHPLADNVRVYVSHGKAVKNPTFVERFGYFPASFMGNPDLKPEHSETTEAGLEWQISPYFSWQNSLFAATLDNEINGNYYDPVTFVGTAINVDGRSHRKGWESEFKANWQDFTASINYSWLRADEPSSNGEQLAELRRPKHAAGVQLSYRFDSGLINLQASYQGSREDINYPSRVELPAYWLLTMNSRYDVNPRLALSLRLENLTDEQYQDVVGYVNQPRRVFFGVTYQL